MMNLNVVEKLLLCVLDKEKNQCELLKKVLSKDEKKILREKIKDIKKNNKVEGVKELHEVICELEVSVMAACVAGSFQ